MDSPKAMKVDYVSLTPADNGVTLSWCEKTSGNSTYENCSYKDYSEVYLEKDIDKALNKFKELWKNQYQARKENKS